MSKRRCCNNCCCNTCCNTCCNNCNGCCNSWASGCCNNGGLFGSNNLLWLFLLGGFGFNGWRGGGCGGFGRNNFFW
ncbi:ground-like protein [Clostridium sp.]|uniref:ground-like protein n=1 Tax=Clostridium sp. TaxID=1506 RepID=UPI003993AAA9